MLSVNSSAGFQPASCKEGCRQDACATSAVRADNSEMRPAWSIALISVVSELGNRIVQGRAEVEKTSFTASLRVNVVSGFSTIR